jgi:hypothetical protein
MPVKRGHLVTEYLENVSDRAIDEYQTIIKDFIRGKNGIYALYKKGQLVYVGLAIDLLKRIDHHLKDRHKGEWDSFSLYVTKNDKHLRELESLIMRVAYPKNNKQTGRFARAINLANDFKLAAKEYFETIQGSLFADDRKIAQKENKQKTKYFKNIKKDMLIVPAKEDGFKKVFIGKNCWHAVRLNENKIEALKYIAAYQVAPISAITYVARIKSIEKYKNTGKYIIYFDGPARKLRKPIKGKNFYIQSLIYGNREALRKAKSIEDVM